MSTGAQRSAECGLYHKGSFLGWFSFFFDDLHREARFDLRNPLYRGAVGGRFAGGERSMMKVLCQRQELVLRWVGTKGTKTESKGSGGAIRFGQLRPGAFLCVPVRVPGLCRLGASSGGRLLERAGAAEHFRREVGEVGWLGDRGVRDDTPWILVA